MKTKLLRKVRQKYSIVYDPYIKVMRVQEFAIGIDIVLYTIKVVEKHNKEQAYKICLDYLQKWIVKEYSKTSPRRSKQIKLWYNPNK